MAQIGSFTLKDGKFTGKIRTLTIDAGVTFVPNQNATSSKAPAFRIFTGTSEIGAAWNKTSEAGKDYISVQLDDPTLAEPLYASLFDKEDGTYALVWNRQKTK